MVKQTFHQTRSSLCPECFQVVGADLVQDKQGLHLEKFCPVHGHFRTRIAADYLWLSNRQQYAAHTVVPDSRQKSVVKGCPADCGECEAHRQRAAFFLFEITNACDLNCPICLGKPYDQGRFISIVDLEIMVDNLLHYAQAGHIVTLGGGEPTLHPHFFEVVQLIKKAGLKDIWLYTNGRRIARDPDFARRIAAENLYVVLQWDGFNDDIYLNLRGQGLLSEKKQALEHLHQNGLRIGLCPTIVKDINDQELGQLYQKFITDPAIGTLDIATMAYVGKAKSFAQGRDNRITGQDVLGLLESQTAGQIRASDFSAVSFSHPECLQIAYHLALPDKSYIPLKRFLEPEDYQSLILNKPLLVLNEDLVDTFHDIVNRLWASGKNDQDTQRGLQALRHVIETLFTTNGSGTSPERLVRSKELVKVVLVHSYMDGLNFDLGRTKMCISRTVLPDGRLMPTCAFNVMHREKEVKE
ncbi:radical SAM protein [candidate division CSSED10-310 bacterium]|uniref:Radical SAM protein n=1 Tax=candidate division CSSED10-310 bacterium TaxID=2855610 RepID=A0ABV6YZB6_UNCC1